jgi:hypothetical protein
MAFTRTLASTDEFPMTACCISGMHRSGTSMVARLLLACGMSLGPEEELNKPAHDNPAGYCENRSFVRLNEEIVAQFGGRWDEPPPLPDGWEFTPAANSFLARAQELVGQSRRPLWGWKDPRNSLTLPFWQRIIPDLKVVICVRNPLEVGRSLVVRGDSRSPHQFQLWMTHYRQILSVTRPEQRLVTHYRSYFHNPHGELRRILSWLEADVSDEIVERACERVSHGLRHHYLKTADLIEAAVPDEVLSLYFGLCAEAGQTYQEARRSETTDGTEQVAGRDREVEALLNEVQHLLNEVQHLGAKYAALERTHAAREQTLDEIVNSRSFKLVSLYWKLRRRK